MIRQFELMQEQLHSAAVLISETIRNQGEGAQTSYIMERANQLCQWVQLSDIH